MGIEMPFVDILIFAVIAVFLIFRLRSILGSREGFEQKPSASPLSEPAGDAENIVSLHGDKANGVGLEAVKKLDSQFSEDSFTQGAGSAFGMILSAFAEGDLATLRRLLGYDLYEDFSESIRQRAKDGDELAITIHDIRDIALTDGEVSQNIASVTVKFTSVQSRTLTDKAGVVIDEDSFEETELTDIWVFERDISLADPNWKLVETRAEDDV
ncbi:MAG: Tim44/TimA family putative adaptor protein [Candidatus Puniceispirillaceae bacterium]|jgi:predicted lipid-binding transport protein (Tim44 family)